MAVTIVPRLPVGLVPEADRLPIGPGVWGDTTIVWPEGFAGWWRNLLTDEVEELTVGRIEVGRVLDLFPVGLMVRESTAME